ncbi:histone-lysine N-methyltransferase ASHR1 isoform X2 [Aristolochia californica]|uniref:histone-lysine N-methyltransferase ASHR1 isoform X2 n=1 Tax=Aristolochia californica TaxID=171875 RepID=UPI0035D7F98A
MEELKSLIPNELRELIYESTPASVISSCSSLIEFFRPLPQFQRVVRELSDPEMALCRKNTASALDFKRKGNECFSSGDFARAVSFYSQALRFAPMKTDDIDKKMVSTVYVNRATSMHKMELLEECIRDCNRAIALAPCYSKAWYRRGQANASLGNYDDAIHNLNVALIMETSSSGESRIKGEIASMLNHRRSGIERSSPNSKGFKKDVGPCVEENKISLKCITTPEKGRGMISSDDIPPSSLIHSEKPYAAVILKQCRETHCHFCFVELSTDIVPCSSCTISLYCSGYCQEQAGGSQSVDNHIEVTENEKLPVNVQKYMHEIIFQSNENVEGSAEHMHECGGANWPVVLPPEIILAGRVLVKFMETKRCSVEGFEPEESLDLLHNYALMPGERKLEVHIYSVVLSYCLEHSCGPRYPFCGASASKLIILISQIKINSMAVIRTKSCDAYAAKGASTTNIEQVRVGQAIYLMGSLFNHSCKPNIHSYFLSRTLFIRSIEFVQAGSSLELSYGPQVGQWNREERQQLLQEQYSFKCNCSACSELNLSDLIIHAFRCVKPNCYGAVLVDNSLKDMKFPRSVPKHEREVMNQVARILLEQTTGLCGADPGFCLTCGSSCNLEFSRSATKKARSNLKWFQDAIISRKISSTLVSDAMKSLDLLRSGMHPYSKDVAQAEDNLAEALCLNGEFQAAVCHCQASIQTLQILEKLYHGNHIVLGNEIMKLASIQLSLNDYSSAKNSLDRLYAILQLHYGSHTVKVLPYAEKLGKEAEMTWFVSRDLRLDDKPRGSTVQ